MIDHCLSIDNTSRVIERTNVRTREMRLHKITQSSRTMHTATRSHASAARREIPSNGPTTNTNYFYDVSHMEMSGRPAAARHTFLWHLSHWAKESQAHRSNGGATA